MSLSWIDSTSFFQDEWEFGLPPACHVSRRVVSPSVNTRKVILTRATLPAKRGLLDVSERPEPLHRLLIHAAALGRGQPSGGDPFLPCLQVRKERAHPLRLSEGEIDMLAGVFAEVINLEFDLG